MPNGATLLFCGGAATCSGAFSSSLSCISSKTPSRERSDDSSAFERKFSEVASRWCSSFVEFGCSSTTALLATSAALDDASSISFLPLLSMATLSTGGFSESPAFSSSEISTASSFIRTLLYSRVLTLLAIQIVKIAMRETKTLEKFTGGYHLAKTIAVTEPSFNNWSTLSPSSIVRKLDDIFTSLLSKPLSPMTEYKSQAQQDSHQKTLSLKT
mmetsp:Transcript_23143/g.34272  ORF Transcript_23143/g.34272 Transcript_23143/m.34272 type:complete len:214 (-) Transcript_23143:674-1315(-)